MSAVARYSVNAPCRICHGYPTLEQGKGIRCAGFLSEDGRYARCTREEYAGALELDDQTTPATFVHLLDGDCRCGTSHGQPIVANGYRRDGTTAARPLEIEHTYDYHDAAGALAFQVVRFAGKDFRQRRPIGGGRWRWGVDGVERVLYRLPELLAADPAALVFIPEGEKDVDRLRSLGLVATTNPMGAGKWRAEYNEPLRGRRVVILPDHDAIGADHGDAVERSLQGVAASVRMVTFGGLPPKGDVSDWLDAGHTVEELLALVEVVPVSTVADLEPDIGADGEPTVDPSWRPGRTDLANAARLAARFGSRLHYVPAWAAWLVWDGQRWRRDDVRRVERYAKATVRGIYAEASKEPDSGQRTKLADWAVRSEARDRIAAMISLAQSEPGIPVPPAEVDADPWLLNCRNGTLDLHSGELRPHRREDLITRLAPIEFDQHAEAPTWQAFLNQIMAGDATLVEYLQRLLGMSLVGEVRDHVLPIAYGTGANGKTTLFEAVVHVLGDYAVVGAPDLLLDTGHERHPTEVADLFGVRLVVCHEPNRGVRLDEAKVKRLTGGDTVKARYMRQDFFAFQPSHTPFLIANHKPVVRGSDVATWRRLKLLPFAVTIPEAEWDVELGVKLRSEGPGILAWMARGCLAWLGHGLGQPQPVTDATAGYRSEMDTFGQFLADRCEVNRTAEVRSSDLYAAYVRWCERERERAMSRTAMGLALAERGFQRRRSGGAIWEGLGLLVDGLDGFTRSPSHEGSKADQPGNPSNPSKSYSEVAADEVSPDRDSALTEDDSAARLRRTRDLNELWLGGGR